MATISTAIGIKHGGLDLAFDFLGLFENSARRFRTTSSTPPSSPALTMLTKRRLKTLGCWASASEKVLPPSMARASSPRMRLRVALRSCFSSTRKPRSSGRPASTSVANWRVKVVRTLGLTLPLRPGILISRFMRAALFLAAGFGGAALAFLSAFFLGLVGLDDFGGEQPHFLDAADGLVLAGDFDGALGLLAVGVQRHVIVFWHNCGSWVLDQVYLTTSSMVVSPSKMLRKPSSRKVTMPSSTAFCRRTTVGARSLISARMASLMISSSKMPLRPL